MLSCAHRVPRVTRLYHDTPKKCMPVWDVIDIDCSIIQSSLGSWGNTSAGMNFSIHVYVINTYDAIVCISLYIYICINIYVYHYTISIIRSLRHIMQCRTPPSDVKLATPSFSEAKPEQLILRHPKSITYHRHARDRRRRLPHRASMIGDSGINRGGASVRLQNLTKKTLKLKMPRSQVVGQHPVRFTTRRKRWTVSFAGKMWLPSDPVLGRAGGDRERVLRVKGMIKLLMREASPRADDKHRSENKDYHPIAQTHHAMPHSPVTSMSVACILRVTKYQLLWLGL